MDADMEKKYDHAIDAATVIREFCIDQGSCWTCGFFVPKGCRFGISPPIGWRFNDLKKIPKEEIANASWRKNKTGRADPKQP